MGVFQFIRTQKVNASIDELWTFISAPHNLKEITPEYMGFDITTTNLPKKMYAGMMISYKVSPLMGFKMNWLTEITQVKEKEFFIDEQRSGPYKLWHHQHQLIPIKNGVLMRDIITYIPPFGILGVIANKWIINRKLIEIFDFRKQQIESIFGKYSLRAGFIRNVS